MTWSTAIRRAAEAVPAHLARFAEQLGELALDLRASVAGLAGDAIGRAVRDALLRFWGKAAATNRHLAQEVGEQYGWPTQEWDGESPPWEEPAPASSPIPEPEQPSRLALALQTGGWLLQHGSLLGLLGVGAVFGGVFLFRGSLAVSGIDLVNAVTEITSLLALLTSASKQLVLS